MLIIELIPDVPPVSGADVSSVEDKSDGSIFWSCQLGTKPLPQQAVYRYANGRSVRVKLAQPDGLAEPLTGRGQFCIIGGVLHLNAWHEVGRKRAYLIPIPECKQPVEDVPDLTFFRTELEKLREKFTGLSFTLLPKPIAPRDWQGKPVGGGLWVGVKEDFGIVARAYLMRVSVLALPNVRLRLGPSEEWPHQATVNAQTNLEIHEQLIVFASPSGAIYLSTVNGSANVWLQIEGYLS